MFNFNFNIDVVSILKKIFKIKKKISDLNILFIDDNEEEFAIIRTLRNSRSYKTVDSMVDLDHFENITLKNADIIFLDIQGVGRKLGLTNGISLVDKIFEIYPEKIITVYSSEDIPKNSSIKTKVLIIPKSSNHETFSSHIREVWETKK